MNVPRCLAIAVLPWWLCAAVACGESKTGPKTCGANPAGYTPAISAANFPGTPEIDNKLYPLAPGTVSTYTATDGKPVTVTVTSDTRKIMGINAIVVHDVVRTAAGELLEDTYDWFAQDNDGNVWYLGEDTTAYSGTTSSKSGSWEAGVDCALPGIAMKASPRAGDTYRMEYLAGQAEDEAEVISLGASITVPYGTFQGCLQTRDFTALEPGKVEHKYFCPGVGFVSSVDIGSVGTGKREDLATVNGQAYAGADAAAAD